jgi:RNA recognition motif-containing protein
MSDGNKLFVGNLSYDATDEDIRKAFAKFQPSDVIIITDRETGRPRGFGFVTLTNESDAEAAKQEMNGFNLLGRPLTVNDASAKKSGGGGGGGGPRRDGGFRNYQGDGYQGGYQQRDNYRSGGGGGGYQSYDNQNGGGYYQQRNYGN